MNLPKIIKRKQTIVENKKRGCGVGTYTIIILFFKVKNRYVFILCIVNLNWNSSKLKLIFSDFSC